MKALITTLGSLLVLQAASALTLSLRPTDDVWVYENAIDPSYDPISRVWGNGTQSFQPEWPPAQNFSYTYLKFDVSSLRGAAYTVLRAELRLTSRPAGYSRDAALANPLEARALDKDFDESTWDYSNPANANPTAQLFGNGDMRGHDSGGDWVVPIDLLQTRSFGRYFNEAVAGDDQLSIALTSRLRVDDMGGQPYRLYTRDFPLLERQPVLDLVLGPGPVLFTDPVPVPEPATMAALLAGMVGLRRRR